MDFLIWPIVSKKIAQYYILHQTKIISRQKQHMLKMTQKFRQARFMKNYTLIAF